jgi:hypothetical protein
MRSVLTTAAWLTLAAASSELSTALPHVRSGAATVHYLHPPGVVLDLRSASGHLDRIPLSYDQTGQQRRGAIWQAKLVYESPRHFIIFTDTYASNANIQGECGASDGERFLHVVSLAPPARETVSVILDSCWRGINATKDTPTCDAKSRTLTIDVVNDSDKEVTTEYQLDENGRVPHS